MLNIIPRRIQMIRSLTLPNGGEIIDKKFEARNVFLNHIPCYALLL